MGKETDRSGPRRPTTPAPTTPPTTPATSTTPPPSDDAIDVGHLLVELMHVVHATRDADAGVESTAHGTAPGSPASVSPHAIRAAMHLGRTGTRTIGQVAEGLGISIGWASRVISELDASGMVVRTPDRTDRRIVHVSLTPEATAIVGRAYLWRAEAIDRALAALDPAGRAAVRTFLRHAVDELPRGRLTE